MLFFFDFYFKIIIGWEYMEELDHFYRDFSNNSDSTISLNDWINCEFDVDTAREMFIYMSSALKYIHKQGYYVSSFYPNDIDILNGAINQIRFNGLERMPDNVAMRKQIVKSNIYSSAFLQVGIYSNCLDYLKSSFLRENFDKFSELLPVEDIPYYKGVVLNGVSVYFDDYVVEKRKRELSELKNMVGTSNEGYGSGKKLIKTNGNSSFEDESINSFNFDFSNNEVNGFIYKQLGSGLKDAAFVSFLIIPTLVSVGAIVFAIVALFMS